MGYDYMRFFSEIAENKVFAVTFFAWILSCVLKGLLECIKQKRLDITRFMGPGGMPSSHSTIVTALAAAVGIEMGFNNPVFAVCCVLALVVMYDAAGVRRAAGQQARILNRMVEQWEKGDFSLTDKRLKELLGHSPIEVMAGALLGLMIAIIRHA